MRFVNQTNLLFVEEKQIPIQPFRIANKRNSFDRCDDRSFDTVQIVTKSAIPSTRNGERADCRR